MGVKPDGLNINEGCGSTNPDLLRATVLKQGADLGIALDGDGDRVLMVDHKGELVDGDELLFIIARIRHESGSLEGPVVGTLMSNLGLEQRLQRENIDFIRAQVGDRYVMELLQQTMVLSVVSHPVILSAWTALRPVTVWYPHCRCW